MEKQTMNAIKAIYKFNQECKRPDGSCLLDQGYNDQKESAFSIEEMLEGFDNTELSQVLGYSETQSPKELSREIIERACSTAEEISDVDRLDKHLDSIVYNFGSIFKLGLTPQEAIKALSIVADANLQKITAGQDEHGKQCKPENFIPPEAKLQKILDERKLNGN